ncbi:MAG: hypothetical protein JST93_26165 [Acidobacteria bacterium]|nr:hypothetical protein [Acidobacteriota bacterium]
MAIHSDAAGVAIEAIEEYLRASDLCLKFRKEDGGCLGYPATLLLFCAVDAIGGYLSLDKRNKIPKGEPFLVFKHPCFGLDLQTKQIKRLEHWYRNGLAHNAVLPPGTCLSAEDGDAFEFALNGDPVKIRVVPLHRLVCGAWKQVDKTLIVPSRVLEPRKMPTVGFESPESIASPVASSGCPLVPKVREL